MQPASAQDYKQLLTDVIKKQIVILGPDITLSKARNVNGLTILNDGTVTNFTGSPQEVTQALIDQFVQLSGLIVKKTMEPLLSLSWPQTDLGSQTTSVQNQSTQPVTAQIPTPQPQPQIQPTQQSAPEAAINQPIRMELSSNPLAAMETTQSTNSAPQEIQSGTPTPNDQLQSPMQPVTQQQNP